MTASGGIYLTHFFLPMIYGTINIGISYEGINKPTREASQSSVTRCFILLWHHQKVKERKYYLRISPHWSATASIKRSHLNPWYRGLGNNWFVLFEESTVEGRSPPTCFSSLCASVLIYCLPEAQAFCKALAQHEIQQSSLSNSHRPLLCLQLLFFSCSLSQLLCFCRFSSVKWTSSSQKSPTSQYLPPRLMETTMILWVYLLHHASQCHFCEFDSHSNQVNRKYNTNMGKAELD